MRNRIERLVLLTFSMGCISETSIATGGVQSPNRSKRNMSPSHTNDKDEEKSADDNESLSDGSLKSLLAVTKLQSLLKNFKSFPQLFMDKDEEMEEDDYGMNIGFPTDVKHVTHIGIDGTSTSILSRGWDNLKEPEPQFHTSPPVHSTPPPSKLSILHEADELNDMFPSENSHHE